MRHKNEFKFVLQNNHINPQRLAGLIAQRAREAGQMPANKLEAKLINTGLAKECRQAIKFAKYKVKQNHKQKRVELK